MFFVDHTSDYTPFFTLEIPEFFFELWVRGRIKSYCINFFDIMQ